MGVLSMNEDDFILTFGSIFNITYIQSLVLRKSGWYLGLEELEITTLRNLRDWVHMRFEECYQDANFVRVVFATPNRSLLMKIYVFDDYHECSKPVAELYFKPRTEGGKEIVKDLENTL